MVATLVLEASGEIRVSSSLTRGTKLSGISLVVKCYPSKLELRVRFSHPAPKEFKLWTWIKQRYF